MALDLRTANWAEIEAAWEAAPPLTLEMFQKLVNLTPERVVVELLCEAPQYDRIEERAQRAINPLALYLPVYKYHSYSLQGNRFRLTCQGNRFRLTC